MGEVEPGEAGVVEVRQGPLGQVEGEGVLGDKPGIADGADASGVGDSMKRDLGPSTEPGNSGVPSRTRSNSQFGG